MFFPDGDATTEMAAPIFSLPVLKGKAGHPDELREQALAEKHHREAQFAD